VDRGPGEGATAPLSNMSEQNPGSGVTRRRALGAVGVGAAGALLPATPAKASAAASAPNGATAKLTSAQVAVIAAVSRAMASVPAVLPYRVGRDLHPLDRVNEEHIRLLAGHLSPAQMSLTRQGIEELAAAGVGSATSARIASTIAAHTEWDTDPGVNAVLLLATATSTPLGFCDAFPPAWRALLRVGSRPMTTPVAPKEAS